MSSNPSPSRQANVQAEVFLPRPFPRLIPALWFVGLGYGLALSWQPLLDHLAYFASYGNGVYQGLLVGLACFGVALPLYQWTRQRLLWRYELLILVGFPLLVCLARDAWATVTVFWILLACYLCGRFLTDRFGLEVARAAEEISLSIAIGLGVFICSLFVLGVVGGYYWWVFTLLFGLPCVLLAGRLRHLGRLLRGFHETWGKTDELRQPACAVIVLFVSAFSVITLISALTPSLAYDAKLFHIPSIKFYAAIHGLRAYPWMNYSYYPQGAEVIQTAAFSLGGQYAAQLLTPSIFATVLLLLYGIVRRMGGSRATTIGALTLAASVPFIHWTGSVMKNDMYLVLFQAAALYCVLRAWKGGPANWLRMGAFCFAMSFGIKHIAIFGGVALGLIVLVEIFRRPTPLRLAASLTLIFLAFGTFWHARTYLETGNPVFPKQTSTAAEQMGPVYGGGLKENEPGRLAYVQTFHFDGVKVFASATSNPLGMFLVMCWTVWFCVRRGETSPVERLCLAFCLLYALYWGWIWGILRYALLPFLLLFALTGLRFLSFARQSGRAIRWSAYATMAYTLVFSLLVAAMIHQVSFAQLRLLTGRSDEAEFLRTVEADYPPLAFLGTVLDADDRVIGVRDCARAYAPALTQYFCAGLGGREGDKSLQRVVNRLRAGEKWDYVIVPVEDQAAFAEGLSTFREVASVYEGRRYAVLRLSLPTTP